MVRRCGSLRDTASIGLEPGLPQHLEGQLLLLLARDEPVDPVESYPTIVADDATAALDKRTNVDLPLPKGPAEFLLG
jgi:hypothetical protein